jgi:hypothetical protein
MAENLLRDTWADLDQADLRLLLEERIGGPGQYDGNLYVLHLPQAREKCRISLTYKGNRIVAVEPGAAFDRSEWGAFAQRSKVQFSEGRKGSLVSSALAPFA